MNDDNLYLNAMGLLLNSMSFWELICFIISSNHDQIMAFWCFFLHSLQIRREVREYFVHLKTQEDWDKAMRNCSKAIGYIPDWFITREMIENFKNHPRIKIYKQHKAQKAAIKNELLSIAWHPKRWWDWCVAEDEKRMCEGMWNE